MDWFSGTLSVTFQGNKNPVSFFDLSFAKAQEKLNQLKAEGKVITFAIYHPSPSSMAPE